MSPLQEGRKLAAVGLLLDLVVARGPEHGHLGQEGLQGARVPSFRLSGQDIPAIGRPVIDKQNKTQKSRSLCWV